MIWFLLLVLILGIAVLVVNSQSNKINQNVELEEAQDDIENQRTTTKDDEPKDNWEKFDFYESKMLPAFGRYKIKYEDQDGLKTERVVQIKRVYENNGKYALDAHCEFRNAHRTFINERVQQAINVETGQVVSNLAIDALEKYKDSDEWKALEAIDKNWFGVALLVFVSRADGQMRKNERLHIASYLRLRSSEIDLDETTLDKAIKAIGEPSYKEFKSMVLELKKYDDKEHLKLIFDLSLKIVETQKIIDPMEKVAIDIISEAIKD